MFRLSLLGLVFGAAAFAVEPDYVPPKADGPVVVLFEDGPDPLIPLLSNPNGAQDGKAVREDLDVYTGLHALRVSLIQKYNPTLPGWAFKIVGKPAAAGEFRYIRFAWRKLGGTGIMVQLHDEKQTWCARYVAGPNTVGWGAISVAEQAPAEWTVVTRDLFKDFGELKLTGMAFTSMDGEGGLFDHVLLGRSIADLDAATEAAHGGQKPAVALKADQRSAYWLDLMGKDQTKASAAWRALLAHAPDQVEYIRKELTAKPVDEDSKKIGKWIADLGAADFDLREAASKGLKGLGAAALPVLEATLKTTDSVEVRFRVEALLRGITGRGGNVPTEMVAAARMARILERAATPEAKKLLEEMSGGTFGAVHVDSSKAALRRLATRK